VCWDVGVCMGGEDACVCVEVCVTVWTCNFCESICVCLVFAGEGDVQLCLRVCVCVFV